jgi:hypothetical protein
MMGGVLFFIIESNMGSLDGYADLRTTATAEENSHLDLTGSRIYGLLIIDLTQFKFYSYNPMTK